MAVSSDTSPQQLCQLCSKINFKNLSSTKGYEHHATLKAWLSSATTCRLCGVLLVATLETPMASFHAANNNDINDKLKDEKFVQSHRIALRLLRSESSSTCDYVSIDLRSRFDPTEDSVRLSGVFVFTNQHDPAATSGLGLPWRRELPTNTGCEASFAMASTWLKACLHEHSDTSPSRDPKSGLRSVYTARRLVELSHSSVRVVDASSVKGPYATLSYSWGPGEQWPWGPRLIRKNSLDLELKKGLPREALPKTIREAVFVAERLGFHYLWVDAMCILQNDDKRRDWLDQSTKMATIYAEAQLNIAASSSAGKEAGLFNEHSSSQHHLYNGCVQVDSTVDGNQSTLYFWYRAPDDLDTGSDGFRDQIDRGSLANRGWVCQERIASPRTLHFGETQLFWQCTHMVATEDNLGTRFPSLEDGRPWRSFFLPGQVDEQAGAYGFEGNELSLQEFDSLWYTFIIPKHYSSRVLTKQTDKLVAIAGLANKLKEYRPSIKYRAGLWSGLELEGLLWSAQGPGQPFDNGRGYVAPSWSWASRNGGVEYGDFGAAFAPFDCKLVECHVETEDEKEFSPLKSASLEIDAASLSGKASTGEGKYGCNANPTLYLENRTITGRALLDDDSEHPLPKDVHALLLRKDSILTVFLLVVRYSEEPERYTRVGIGSVQSFRYPDSFDKLPRSSWVIV